MRLRFAGRILPFDDAVAERWGQIGLTLATRVTTDIAPTNVPMFNPWLSRQA